MRVLSKISHIRFMFMTSRATIVSRLHPTFDCKLTLIFVQKAGEQGHTRCTRDLGSTILIAKGLHHDKINTAFAKQN